MQTPEPRFYFALPRLLAKLRGGSSARTEQNWPEISTVGALIHLIVYSFAAQLFLQRLELWKQLALAIPLAVLVWLVWLLVLYLNSLGIRLLRAGGIMRDLPKSRAQGLLIGIMTTGCAYSLALSNSWLRILGEIWLVAVVLNLGAAALLRLLGHKQE